MNFTIVGVIYVLAFLSVVCLAVVFFFCLECKQRRSNSTIIAIGGLTSNTIESLKYNISQIRAATANFSDANKLGRGGFGFVYKGRFVNGQEIAVKRLSVDSAQGNAEFQNEVLVVAKLQHRNLVKLLGFALEGREKLLVYEFVEKASLDNFIFDPVRRSTLDWDTRTKIIKGVVRGLVYLHVDSRDRIIHRDLKAANILLDGDMNPKIADFGLAKLSRHDEIEGNTQRIVGTRGYMAPEYLVHGEFSIKSDVYSFGVIILEIISGRRNFSHGETNLLADIWRNWLEGKPEDIIDPMLRNNSTSFLSEIVKYIHIGLLCVHENATDRPTMIQVLCMLDAPASSFSEPVFYPGSRFGAMTQAEALVEDASRNEMSLTQLYPR